jgi:probable HAF family extracellular repeat protein
MPYSWRAAVWNPDGSRIILDIPPDYDNSWAWSINDAGQVVGSWGWPFGAAFVWSKDTGTVELPRLGGYYSDALAINNAGQIIGWSTDAEGWVHGCLWTPDGNVTDLGIWLYDIYDINDAGQIAGSFSGHALLWTGDAGGQYLGELPGHNSSYAYSINDSGQIAGWSFGDNFLGRAFLWTAETGMIDLGKLRRFNSSYGYGINKSGQVVGWCYNAPNANGGRTRAFTWSASAGMIDLGTLPGHKSSYAFGINDSGQIVGYSEDRLGRRSAVLWTPKM